MSCFSKHVKKHILRADGRSRCGRKLPKQHFYITQQPDEHACRNCLRRNNKVNSKPQEYYKYGRR